MPWPMIPPTTLPVAVTVLDDHDVEILVLPIERPTSPPIVLDPETVPVEWVYCMIVSSEYPINPPTFEKPVTSPLKKTLKYRVRKSL